MAHTQQSVLRTLGKEAQVSGGAIIVYRGGKHIAVSKFVNGVFELTPEGLEVLDSPQVTTPEGVDVVIAGKAKQKAGKGSKQEYPVELEEVKVKTQAGFEGVDFELDLDNVELGGN